MTSTATGAADVPDRAPSLAFDWTLGLPDIVLEVDVPMLRDPGQIKRLAYGVGHMAGAMSDPTAAAFFSATFRSLMRLHDTVVAEYATVSTELGRTLDDELKALD